jgi:hypothetical protein
MTVWSIWRWELSARLRLRALRLRWHNFIEPVTPEKPEVTAVTPVTPEIEKRGKHYRQRQSDPEHAPCLVTWRDLLSGDHGDRHNIPHLSPALDVV